MVSIQLDSFKSIADCSESKGALLSPPNDPHGIDVSYMTFEGRKPPTVKAQSRINFPLAELSSVPIHDAGRAQPTRRNSVHSLPEP